MSRLLQVAFAAAVISLPGAAPALAQSAPSPAAVGEQFNSGANSVGRGAVQIGQGIKNGAIMTWQALSDGANAFASRISGQTAPASPSGGSSAP
jgi:hypothetical protein